MTGKCNISDTDLFAILGWVKDIAFSLGTTMLSRTFRWKPRQRADVWKAVRIESISAF